MCAILSLCKLMFFSMLISTSTSIQYVSPLYSNEITGSVVYDRVAPIVFRFVYPNLKDKTLIALKDISCTSPSSSHICSVFFYLEEVISIMRPLITSEKTMQKEESNFNMYIDRVDQCSSMTQHFSSLYTKHEVVSKYLEQLKSCSNGLDDIQGPNFDFLTPFEPYYEFTHSSYDQKFPANDIPTEAAHTILVSLLTTLGLTHYAHESRRWEDAANQCKNFGIIPSSLVSSVLLKTSLQKLFLLADNSNLRLAIPMDDQSISRYWNTKNIADCTFSTSPPPDLMPELIVHINVPLIKKTDRWSTHEVYAIPFRHVFENKPYICVQEENEIPNIHVFESSKGVSYNEKDLNCNIQEHKHCSAATMNKSIRKLNETCVSAELHRKPFQAIAQLCPMRCDSPSKFLPVMIKQVASNTFYITGDPTTATFIICPKQNSKELFYPPEKGSMKLTLSCGCYIDSEGTKYYVQDPCGNSISTDILIPINFQYGGNTLLINIYE